MATKIQWTEETWNPISGCRRKSPGCQNCYAERQAHRLAGNPNEKIRALYSGITQITNGRPGWTGECGISENALLKPLRTRKPTTYFISLSDLFYDGRTDEDIDRVFSVMQRARQHTFQILTKYVERAYDYLSLFRRHSVDGFVTRGGKSIDFSCGPVFDPARWPLPNVWLGVSVEDRQRKQRIDVLRQTPSAVRFLSLEPLLEDIGTLNLCGIDWVIAGAESGPGARPAREEWFRSIKDQCVAAGVPFFLKQYADERGRKIGLPELDGRQWVEMPR